MNWCARHPFLLWLVFLTADILTARHLYVRAVSSLDTEKAGWSQMCIMAIIFGTLCIRFPHILGSMEGPVGRGGWLNPTPHSLVKVIGWGMMAVPLLLLLALF